MQKRLYKYLLLHHHLNIPALGSFVVEWQPAYYNESTELLFPRRPVIHFNEGPATAPDKILIRFLSDLMKVDEATAEKSFKNFAIELIVLMVDQHFIELYGIGKIKKDINGHLVFLPGSNLIDIIPPLRPGDRIELGNKAKKIIPIETPTVHKEDSSVLVSEKEQTEQVILEQTVVAKTETVPKTIQVPKPIDLPKPTVKEPIKQKESAPQKPMAKESPKPIVKETQKPVASISLNKGARVVGMNAEPEDQPASWKTKWWIYAAVLALAGLVALLIHIL